MKAGVFVFHRDAQILLFFSTADANLEFCRQLQINLQMEQEEKRMIKKHKETQELGLRSQSKVDLMFPCV